MPNLTDPSAPPSRALLLLEVRAIGELGAFFSMAPLLRLTPRGDGHPVLVLPGLGGSDAVTRPLRAFLKDRGYHTHGWKLGTNNGPRLGVEQKMLARLAELADRHRRNVSLIGASLGGVFARELARNAPAQVRSVVTLGSPFAGEPRASNAGQFYERLSERKADDWPERERERMRSAPPVPCTAIFSRSDGIVAWQGCMEREGRAAENIEVEGSHCGPGPQPDRALRGGRPVGPARRRMAALRAHHAHDRAAQR